MPGLIVSVRSAEEARIALENGADLIDVKEPSRGALGRADDAVIEAVLDAVAGRLPVSAALGELAEGAERSACAERLAFLKAGLAGMRHRDWAGMVGRAVPCAYADFDRAAAPIPLAVCEAACRLGSPALLIDTWGKDGSTLLDWLDGAALDWIIHRCRESGVKLALAGSLSGKALETASALGPEWVAVRGAVCEGGRGGRLSAERVRAAAALVRKKTDRHGFWGPGVAPPSTVMHLEG
ncbi:MAG: (5-formylfuran-3-yl)methyl phosphate synthase [Gemmataceae bacterium]|nr:(5-formylfuran-3-yl)methyl phosphate synthase [Gemmataceae bacterium]